MENKNTGIPEEIIEVCRAFAKVAKESGLHKFSGNFDPRNTHGWDGSVSFNWEAGRHGEDSNHFSITSQFYVHATINEQDGNK
jgi:hypothetical protein